VVSPQDLIGGSAQTAIETLATPEETVTTTVVETATRYSSVAPRFKPRRMKTTDPELTRATAPHVPPAVDLTPAYQGVVLPDTDASKAPAFRSGEGGPTKAMPPADASQPELPQE
jgi:hypothetical protein